MAIGSGVLAQFGWAIETTSGTRQTPVDFAEFNSESLALSINRIERMGLRAGRRVSYGWSAGTQQVEGSIEFDLSVNTVGSLWRACLGAVSTTGSGTYTHTFTPGDLPSLTVQIGRPFTSGTVQPFDYVGCRVQSWELTGNPNEFARVSLDLVGEDEDTGQSLASASYGQGNFFTFAHGELNIASSEVCIDSVSVTGANNLDVYHKICSTNPGFPTIREAGMRDYGGTFTADFESLTAYNRFVNGTEAALSLTFEVSTTQKLTITGNVRFDGTTPNVPGAEVLKNTLPFKFTSSTSDAAAITVELINSDSTP